MQCSNFSYILNPSSVKHFVREWLMEDTSSFDFAGFAVGEKVETALIFIKSPGILAGCPFIDALFNELDCKVEWKVNEGTWIEPITVAALVIGKVRHLLLGERVALNCLSRACGVATECKKLLKITENCKWAGEIAGTRKTTPGFRLVEKYALLVGGVSTHRYDLSSMILIKDNHILSTGSIKKAVRSAKVVGGFSTKIEVECQSLEDAIEASEAGCDIVMFDNFSPEALASASSQLKQRFPNVLIEASGGITDGNLSHYCLPAVDIISSSRLVQGYDTVDVSMKIEKDVANGAVLQL